MATQARQNESALICAARQGDKEALRLLLLQNWAWLKGLVYSVIGNNDDVDDVLQDICVRVISKIETIRKPERFRPWLATIAQRQVLQHRLRKKQNPISLTEGLAYRQCDEKNPQCLEKMEQKEQYQQIIKAVKSLPEKYRQVFILQYSSDLTYGQIAEILGVPITTVQIRLVRARRMIYDRLKGKDKQKVSEGRI